MIEYIDQHRQRFGVEPICRTLRAAGVEIAPSSYYAAKSRLVSQRASRDRELKAEIVSTYQANFAVYGARKVWQELRQTGRQVARCTVERLMGELGLQGVVRGKKRFTTLPGEESERSPDRVNRDFKASAPNKLWVADFTYVASWSGTVYVSMVIDAYSRRIVGWKASKNMKTELVLDSIEMALWSRGLRSKGAARGLIHHSDRGGQYTSFAFSRRLLEAGVDASVGSVGDGYDNALAESTIGLYKAELIHRRRTWKTFSEVELATSEWVDWYNHRRLHSSCGYRAPAAYETAHAAHPQPSPASTEASA